MPDSSTSEKGRQTYLRIAQEDEDHSLLKRASLDVTLTEPESLQSRAAITRRRRSITWLHWAGHLVLTILLIASVWTSGFRRRSNVGNGIKESVEDSKPFIRTSESFYDNITLLAKQQPFYYDRKPHIDPVQEKWKGRPNDENEKLWATLSSVGFVSITADEAARMKLPTARNIRQPDEYVVAPQVFHDIHCVQMLRDIFWQAIDGTLVVDGTLKHNIPHYDHCFHSLRQSLTCTADLSPLTWYWSHKKLRYVVVWDSVRQCRSWDNVMEWATKRNSTGMLPTRSPDKNVTSARLDEMSQVGLKMPWDA